MVIFNHTNERGYFRYLANVNGSTEWLLNLIPSIVCKSAVPIFFMISGALLLGKNESVRKTYLRIVKIFLDLIFFSVLYYMLDAYLSKNVFDLRLILLTMLQSSYWHLWYLYAYIVLILTMPFLRDFAHGLTLKNYKILYVLVFITRCILPIFEYFVYKIDGSFKPYWITADIFFFPLTGYIIEKKIDVKRLSKRFFLNAWGLNVICFVVSIVSEYFRNIKNPQNSDETFIWLFCCINAPLIHLTVKKICEQNNHNTYFFRIKFIIAEIAECTFGIYLFHIIFLWKIQHIYRFMIDRFERGMIGSRLGIYLSCGCIFVITGGLTYVLRKVPIIKKLL